MNLKNLLTWWELLGVNSNLAKSLKTEESILFSHLKISGPSSYPFYVYVKKVSSAVNTLLALIVKRIMIADQTNTHQINQEKRYNAIEYVGFYVFKILQQQKKCTAFYSIFHPFLIIKSALILMAIRKDVMIQNDIKLPPKSICAFIQEQSVWAFITCLLSSKNCYAEYWLLDLRFFQYLYT